MSDIWEKHLGIQNGGRLSSSNVWQKSGNSEQGDLSKALKIKKKQEKSAGKEQKKEKVSNFCLANQIFAASELCEKQRVWAGAPMTEGIRAKYGEGLKSF